MADINALYASLLAADEARDAAARGLASYHVTASLPWLAGVIAVTAPSPQVTCAQS